MAQIVREKRRRIQQGMLVFTTHRPLLNVIRSGKISVIYKYNPLNYQIKGRTFITSY